eukprot:NODE_10881_length_426_cov_1.480106_g9764_i0.p1 GENE.NODE_10881_length_426_cov_1.480106_g9764_i0~~NODE_10881_length_426_cov_1.480106_g9764_i0.p1  ORF type:complete len:65 (+),score=2.84 NODE_10881_length_426_cov_1.480106_g9764_i0:139-333(+)
MTRIQSGGDLMVSPAFRSLRFPSIGFCRVGSKESFDEEVCGCPKDARDLETLALTAYLLLLVFG